MHFKMSSAIRFSLDQSKILSTGNGLTNYKYSDSIKLKKKIAKITKLMLPYNDNF